MAITTVGASSTLTTNWCNVTSTGVNIKFTMSLPVGVYRVRQWTTAMNTTPTATVFFIGTSGASVATGSLIDWDTGSTGNYAEQVFNVASDIAGVVINTNTAGWMSVEQLGSVFTGATSTITSYTTSQTVTIASAASCVLMGGGGGGGLGGNSGGPGGGGGGSGYITKFSIAAGSYALVCGAAGAGNGGTGGTSTFNGNSAIGGNGGTTGAGGNGGSGGGGQNQAGASNGGSAGGTGSGVVLPYWITPGNGGTAQGATGAGIYAGGGGGGTGGGGVSPGGAAMGGGGGGGSNSTVAGNNNGSAGFIGGLYVGIGV